MFLTLLVSLALTAPPQPAASPALLLGRTLASPVPFAETASSGSVATTGVWQVLGTVTGAALGGEMALLGSGPVLCPNRSNCPTSGLAVMTALGIVTGGYGGFWLGSAAGSGDVPAQASIIVSGALAVVVVILVTSLRGWSFT